MPSYLSPLDDQPIVFNAFLKKISSKELWATFQKMKPFIARNKRTIWILDVTCWEMTHDVVTCLAGAMATNEAGSPADHNVTTLIVSKKEVTEALEAYFADHRTDFGMVLCSSLDMAYQYALFLLNLDDLGKEN